MTGMDQERACGTRTLKVRYGRIATKHARSLHYRFWLQAAERLAANYVGFTPSTGNVSQASPAI